MKPELHVNVVWNIIASSTIEKHIGFQLSNSEAEKLRCP
jgi:hypothetical protein